MCRPDLNARARRTLTFHRGHGREDDHEDPLAHESDLEPSSESIWIVQCGSGYHEKLIVAYSRRKPKRGEPTRKRRKRKRRKGGWRQKRSAYLRQPRSYPLVNIGRQDGSWESARGENKDTRCSGTDNDRRPTDRLQEAVRNATTDRGDLQYSRHFCRHRG